MVLWRVCGRADDGGQVEISLRTADIDRLRHRWPPIGMVWSVEPLTASELHIEIVPSSSDEPLVIVDGVGSVGGWDRVESELALFASERLADLVAVHAAVIVKEGRALLVPGVSGVGKSSLCMAAIAAGAQVLTDEYALVDPISGLVTGWRRPLRVRRRQGGVDRLNLAVESHPVPVGLVALVRHEPDNKAGWGPIPASEVVLGLLANTVCARSRPDEAVDAALVIGRTAPGVGGGRGEADEAIRKLLALLVNDPPDGKHGEHRP